jgi:hypothetical protein
MKRLTHTLPVLAAAFALPFLAHAESFKDLVNTKIVPLGDKVVTLFYALAFIFFLIGMVRFFFLEGEEGREKGKGFMLWGMIGLVVLFSVWGLVHLLLGILSV